MGSGCVTGVPPAVAGWPGWPARRAPQWAPTPARLASGRPCGMGEDRWLCISARKGGMGFCMTMARDAGSGGVGDSSDSREHPAAPAPNSLLHPQLIKDRITKERSPGPSAAPLQSQELHTQHRPQLAAQAHASHATSTYAAAGSRDGGPIRHAVQPRQLLPNDAALQPRMDGLHLRLLACRGAGWDGRRAKLVPDLSAQPGCTLHAHQAAATAALQ